MWLRTQAQFVAMLSTLPIWTSPRWDQARTHLNSQRTDTRWDSRNCPLAQIQSCKIFGTKSEWTAIHLLSTWMYYFRNIMSSQCYQMARTGSFKPALFYVPGKIRGRCVCLMDGFTRGLLTPQRWGLLGPDNRIKCFLFPPKERAWFRPHSHCASDETSK